VDRLSSVKHAQVKPCVMMVALVISVPSGVI
jgi:hypothetical protein